MFSVDEIASRLSGYVVGDGSTNIVGVASLKRATDGDLAYLSKARFLAQLRDTKASAVLLSEPDLPSCPTVAIVVDAPQAAFSSIAAAFEKRELTPQGVHETAAIHSTATLGEGVRIGPYVHVGAATIVGDHVELCAGVSVGNGSTVGTASSIRESVVVYHDVRIGARCTVHANAVIGADGFGIEPRSDGTLMQTPQVGGVTIGDDVLIGASTTIDRGTSDDTILHDDVKVDDQVHIGHNCEVGAHSILCGKAALAGSVTLGQYCVLAGAAGIAGEGPVNIASGVQIGAMTFVSRDIDEPGRYSGNTLHGKNSEWRRNVMHFNKLNDMAKRLRKLEQRFDLKQT